MTRSKTTITSLFAVALLAVPGFAQAPETPEKQRRQPVAVGFEAKVDAVFGTAIEYLTHYPFTNVAGWFGLDTDPHLLRDEKSNEPTTRSIPLPGHTGAVTIAIWAPDSGSVLTAAADNVVRLFDLRASGLFAAPHPAVIHAAAFYPDGGEFATACADGKIRVFGTTTTEGKTTWSEVLEIDGHAGGATRVGYSQDGTWLWSFGADNTVRLWGKNGRQQLEHKAVADGLRAVHISADGDLLQMEEVVFVLDGAGDVMMHKANGTELGKTTGLNIQSLQMLPDGSLCLARVGPGSFRVIDPKGSVIGQINLADDATAELATIATGETGPRITVEDSTGMTRVFEQNGREISAEKTRPTGYYLQADPRSPNSVALRSRSADLVWVLQGHGDTVLGHALAPNGTRALTCSKDGSARIWEWFVHGPDGSPVTTNIPFVVLWLVIAAIVFTLYMRFVNIRLFGHAIQVVRGKFSNPDDHGEVSHFQALSSALSATVGLGNIAGVAIAVSVGGPGATFWMVIAGLLGMTLKFTECTLGQKFRKIDDQGRVSGGPMHYLKDGLRERGLVLIGVPLSIIFTVFCIGGSLAGGNAFQVNQSGNILKGQVPFFADYPWVYGLILAFFVGIVIIGGIRRIAQTAEKIVPTMCGIYVLAALTIIGMNVEAVPGAFGTIIGSALSGDAIYGGALGALIMGFRRAAFSNEAGVGSASIAHSAARTPYPVREGIVALLEPFIDTVVVCTMTALVIVITGVYNTEQFPEYAAMVAGNNGAGLTAKAFGLNPVLAGWFPWVLMTAVVLFAFSTMISWSYYGERCWTNLFGPNSSLSFKVVFLVFTVLGSIVNATNVLEFGDVMILLMAFPNILGLYFLGSMVKDELREYEEKRHAGEFQVYK